MKTTTATTFKVSDVVRAVQPLPEVPYKQAVETLLTRGDPDWKDEWDGDEDEDDLIDERARADAAPARSKPAPATTGCC